MRKNMYSEIQRGNSKPVMYKDLDSELREQIDVPLRAHMHVAGGMMKWRKTFTPLINIRGNTEEENDVMAVPREYSSRGFECSYEYAVDVLRGRPFEIALYSYSTKKKWMDEKAAWFFRTIVFLGDGTEIDTVSRITFRGFFRRRVEFNPIVVTGIRKNVFG